MGEPTCMTRGVRREVTEPSDESEELFHIQLARHLREVQLSRPNYSLRALAKRVGLSPSTVSRYLNGSMRPSARTIRKVGAILGWSDDLIHALLKWGKRQAALPNKPETPILKVKIDAINELQAGLPPLNEVDWRSLSEYGTQTVVMVNSARLQQARERSRLFYCELLEFLQDGERDQKVCVSLSIVTLDDSDSLHG